jgi:hypothetical protein
MNNHKPFVSVYMPIAGWKAIVYSWDTEFGFWEPWETGSFAYITKAEAIVDAKQWAKDTGLEFHDIVPSAVKEAPRESVTEQLQALIPGLVVVNLK